MTITLQRFATSDTNYIGKHNSNADALEAAIATLDAILAGITGIGALSISTAFEALFGSTVAVIGATSYACSGLSTTLTVEAGFCWRPTLQQVLNKASSTPISFSGLSAATYYIQVDSTGTPLRTLDSTEAVYSIIWDGGAFGTITRLANIAWAEEEWLDAQVSAALGASYNSLDARLEAGEVKAFAGDLARTWQLGRLSKSVAGGADVTLTATEANNLVLNCTGLLTANINLIVPLGTNPRFWIVENNTTGSFTLTVKGSTGTGAAVTQGSALAVFQNGTDVAAPSSAQATNPYDVGGTYNGAPTASLVLMRFPFPRQVIFPAGLTNAHGVSNVAATAQTDFDIKKNGSSVGTMRFAAAATTATFIMASQTTFAAGDILTVVAPGTPDATLADIGFSLAGTR